MLAVIGWHGGFFRLCGYLSFFSLLIVSIYPAVITPAGRATIAIPKTEESIVIIFFVVVTG